MLCLPPALNPHQVAAAAAPLRVSVKPAAGQAPPAPPAPGPLAPGPDDEKPPAEPRDARRGPGYLSANPYRFRYSLEGSPTYMNLRNRLTSLGQRARADSQRSMASLLGGDARREEARAHAAVQPEPPQPQAELRRSLGDAQDRVDEFVAAELASGTVSYSPDYHEWSLDQSLDAYEFHRSDAAGADDLQQAEPPQPEPAYVEPEPEPAPAPVYEPEPAPEPELVYHEPEAEPAPEPEPEPDPEPEAQPQAQPAALQDGAQLQLEGMIRQIIEPELYRWFDEHLAFCIVIPPPNVTGSLHMGHALNNTLQDILCRYERMRGRDVLWQPGMDHAGIATQMVVERQMAERNRAGPRDIGREAFVEKVWELERPSPAA
jgi:hypothetical protein